MIRTPSGVLVRALSALALAASISACSGPTPEGAEEQAVGAEEPAAGNFRERIYERNFVFTTLAGDTAFMVPWLTSARVIPGGVDRAARGWLARGESWEGFLDARWETPPTRVPGRLLPHGSFRVLVGEGNAILSLLYEEGARELELTLDSPLMEWVDQRGHTFRLLEGSVYLADRQVAGMALDMTRVRDSDQPDPGDWAFLVSGDSLQVVLESPASDEPGAPGAYRGWARLDFRDVPFDALTVEWGEVRAFQPARQDVPVAWTVTSASGDLEGVLEVRTAQIQAGEGDGPVLPVDALFEVSGTMSIEGSAYPVRGLFRHVRN